MIHPTIAGSPRSRMIKAITFDDPTTTKTWARTLLNQIISQRPLWIETIFSNEFKSSRT
jgi:hypothetical protein